jgi:hypothetical protein
MTSYLISFDTLKTIANGAMGAMTFGAYHQFTTNKIMELNNENLKMQNKMYIEKIEKKHKVEMDEFKAQLAKLEQKKGWFY